MVRMLASLSMRYANGKLKIDAYKLIPVDDKINGRFKN